MWVNTVINVVEEDETVLVNDSGPLTVCVWVVETVSFSVVPISTVTMASVMGICEDEVSVVTDVTDGLLLDNLSVYTAVISSVDTSFVDMEIVAEGLTADALHWKPLKFNASLAKKVIFVPRSVVTTNLGPSRPQ